MKIIETIINKDINIRSDLADKKICFIDIETTGLSRSKDSIYLIGIVYFDNDILSWKIVQLFAEELREEINILLKAHKLLYEFDIIVNYNGTSFDIPFINSKLDFYKTNLSVNIDKSLDLYRIIRSNKNILQLENYKLESIEKYLGIYRKDKYTGKDCIKFYRDYLATKNTLAKENILLHNYEDLYYLLDVIDILDILESKNSFSINHNGYDNYFVIDSIQLKKDYLFIKGHIEDNSIGNIIHFDDNYKVIFGKDNSFEVSLEVIEGMVSPTQKCIFIEAVSFGLPKKEYWNHKFRIPKGIILLSVEKNYYIENIKLVIRSLIERILR